jgi:hypothetical protein
MIAKNRPAWTEEEYKGYTLMCGSFEHMLAHVPTLEMAEFHPWHIYNAQSLLVFTGTKADCKAAIDRWVK